MIIQRIFLSFCFLFSMTPVFSQGYEITVISSKLPYDSLHLQSFDNSKIAFNTFHSIPYGDTVTFQGKNALQPGLYQISSNAKAIATFFISGKTEQKIGILVQPQGIKYQNSEENNINNDYVFKMSEFDGRILVLSNKIKENQNLPEPELQRLFDSVLVEMKKVESEKYRYQQATAQRLKGTLLASAIKASMVTPVPAELYTQDRGALQHYQIIHFFDTYPFEDERLLNTPLSVNRFQQFASLLCRAEAHIADTLLIHTLTKSKISSPVYFSLFDNLESIIGNLHSPCWNETLYSLMLENALQYEKTDEARALRYQHILARIMKNRKGEKIPEFAIKLSDGTIRSIYDIEGKYTLLYFHNPDCPNCLQVKEIMNNMDILNQAIDSNRLIVVTVYFEKDETLWQQYLREAANPKYINGWDYLNEIESKDLLDIRLIPFMFLLDKDKKVIKKDLRIHELEKTIAELE